VEPEAAPEPETEAGEAAREPEEGAPPSLDEEAAPVETAAPPTAPNPEAEAGVPEPSPY
jgi:hypothetical protein